MPSGASPGDAAARSRAILAGSLISPLAEALSGTGLLLTLEHGSYHLALRLRVEGLPRLDALAAQSGPPRSPAARGPAPPPPDPAPPATH